jgi:phage/plasmid-associated DNA primase
MRELIAGAFLSFERKGKDMEAAYCHPRVLITTNVHPRIHVSDRAEFTRIRRIDVRPLEGNNGDRGWPKKLLEQMPAFLWACREVYQRFATPGHDLPITDACRAALEGGAAELAEEFDFLAERLEVTGDENDFVPAKKMVELFDQAKYQEWKRSDARRWLVNSGAWKRTKDGKKETQWIGKKAVAVWRGVREIDAGPFGNISAAK